VQIHHGHRRPGETVLILGAGGYGGTGRLPLPFNGPSTASKAALEAFADVHRTELRAWAAFELPYG
jgi:hypothetical protein